MLAPHDRRTLLDALRPPIGHRLDQAVGTTFSLNLDSLLIAPAAFALFDVGDRSPADVEPVELLDSIRRHADRITVFCQAGQLPVPHKRRLFTWLEEGVIPVTAPGGGVFHPKVWVLRFVDDESGAVRHRVLCASRNLTFDRSWDTLLRLDSTDGPPTGAVDVSGLADFVASLPGMAVGALGDTRRVAVAALADELRGVRLALPAGFSTLRFWPLGIGHEDWPFPPRCDRLLVVSPFLGAKALGRLPQADERRVLVARAEEIDGCPTAAAGFDEVFVLDPDVTPEAPLTVGPADDGREHSVGDPGCALEGLHAKLYVVDDDGHTRVFTGSANATTAAFGANVELLAELHLPSRTGGVERLLAEDGTGVSLRRLLLPYEPAADAVDRPDETAEDRLDALRRAIAAVPLQGRVAPGRAEDSFTVRYHTTGPLPTLPGDVSLRCWPVTLPGAARPLESDASGHIDITFETSLESVTAFVAVELSDHNASTAFVLIAELLDAPADRRAKMLRIMLGDAARFLRYLLLLLSDEQSDRFELASILDDLEDAAGGGSRGRPAPPAVPLLEAMLRVLASNPRRLRQVEDLVEELRQGGDDLLPAGFDDVWGPIYAVAKELMA